MLCIKYINPTFGNFPWQIFCVNSTPSQGKKKFFIENFVESTENFINFCQHIKSLSYIFIQILLVVAVVVFVVQTYLNFSKQLPVIEPFDVPKSLEEQGYSGKVVAQLFIDAQDDIRRQSKTLASRDKSESEAVVIESYNEEKSIMIPGMDFSLNMITNTIFQLIGLKKNRINGNLMLTDKLTLELRITGKPSRSFAGEPKHIKKLIRNAALHSLKLLSPMTIGVDYFVKGDISAIKSLIQTIRKNKPCKKNISHAYILEGFIYSIQGNHSEALVRYNTAEKLFSNNVIANYMIADALRWLKQPQKAILKYRKCLQVNPDDIEIYTKLAAAYVEAGRPEKVLSQYKKALSIDPLNARIYMNWGDLLTYQLHEPEKAVSKYKLAARLEPGNSNVYCRWGNALIEMNKYEDAASKFQKSITLAPGNISPYIAWGNMLMNHLNNPLDAIDKFQQASKVDSTSAEIYSLWATALVATNQRKSAIKKFKKAISLESENVWIYIDLVHALIQLKRLDEAIENCQTILKINPNSIWGYALWAYALIEQKNPEKAIIQCKKALEIDPNFSFAYAFFGYALAELNQSEEAIKKCEKATQLDKHVPIANFIWASVLLKQRHFEASLSKFEKAVEIEPDEAKYYYQWGNALKASGKTDQALLKYKEAHRLNPESQYGQKSLKQIQSYK